MRRVYRNSAIAIAAFVVLVFALYPLLLDRLERAMISTGPNGPETPSTVGLAYERLKIPSGSVSWTPTLSKQQPTAGHAPRF